MKVLLDVPEEMAPVVAAGSGELPRATLEAVAVEGVRSGKLTVFQARQMLGISSRYEMDGFLKDREVYLYNTLEEVLRDAENAAKFMR